MVKQALPAHRDNKTERYLSTVLSYIDPSRHTESTSEVVVVGVIFWVGCNGTPKKMSARCHRPRAILSESSINYKSLLRILLIRLPAV